jgi:hypothetical protein
VGGRGLFGSTAMAPSSAFDDVRRVMETMENLLESPMLLAHTGTTIPLDVIEVRWCATSVRSPHVSLGWR